MGTPAAPPVRAKPPSYNGFASTDYVIATGAIAIVLFIVTVTVLSNADWAVTF